jgi:hypothetical protein
MNTDEEQTAVLKLTVLTGTIELTVFQGKIDE